MDTNDKLKALDETERDLRRDILGLERKLENVEDMANPAQSQKEYNEIIEELNTRIVINTEIKKDIKFLGEMKTFLVPPVEEPVEEDGEQPQKENAEE